MQLTKEQSDVLEPRQGKDEPSGGVHHWLQPWQEMWWNAGECRIAIVKPREDERRHQRLKNRSRQWPTDSPELTQYRAAGRYRFHDVRPHRDITVDVERRKLVKYGRSWPGAVTAAADEDGGWLWTRETRSSQCSCNRLERIHAAPSSMHADIRVSRFWDADGRQEPNICVLSA